MTPEAFREAVLQEVAKAYIGPRENVALLLEALLAGGHVLVQGVPGIAKTTLAKAFARAIGCTFRRIQFTPDLLPSDITGTHVWLASSGEFAIHEGPIFAQIVLADEINRAPPKTQAALLEAMQERQVTIEGETRALPAPFMVLATQNPIEYEGTYRLPEAELDRFTCLLELAYPSYEEEDRILTTYTATHPEPEQVAAPEVVRNLQGKLDTVYVSPAVRRYVLDVTRATRNRPEIYLGASPRAGLALVRLSQARALLQGRDHVLPEDVKALVHPVFGHRIVLTDQAEVDGMTPQQALSRVLRETAVVPRNG